MNIRITESNQYNIFYPDSFNIDEWLKKFDYFFAFGYDH